ncbi:MAG: TIM barrel protein [Planctomycetes bacterium]|nr:TIM barrel protein [Planctomycetota bacterium]
MRIRQSFCQPLYQTDGMSLDRLFRSAAEIGYIAVETWFRDESFEEFAAAAKQNGLAVASICGHKDLADGLNNRASHDRIESELAASIDLAARLKIAGLICFSGNRRAGLDENDAIDAVVAGLKRSAPYAEKMGVNLNLELLNSKVDHPGYQADHSAWGLEVCRRVNSPRVKLLYDIYHMQIMEGDVIRTIRENIRWIGHFHTAGNPGRNDMDDTQELNYAGICQAIADSGYEYFVGHEFKPKADPIQALRNAFATCDRR